MNCNNWKLNKPSLVSCFLSGGFITAIDMKLEHKAKPNFIHNISNFHQNDYTLIHTNVPANLIFQYKLSL